MSLLQKFNKVALDKGRLDELSPSINFAIDYVTKHAERNGIDTLKVILLGGAGLYAHGLRDEFDDLDFMIEDQSLQRVLPSTKIVSPATQKTIEFGFELNLGSLEDPKAFERTVALEKSCVNGVSVEFSIYPPEYSLMLKTEQGREKCQRDIARMLMSLDHLRVIEAFNNIALCNEQWVMDDLADMLIVDYLMLVKPGLMLGDNSTVLKDVCSGISISKEKRKDLLALYNSIAGSIKKSNTRPVVARSESFTL